MTEPAGPPDRRRGMLHDRSRRMFTGARGAFRLVLALAAVAALLVACQLLPVPPDAGPLVTVEARGGLCPAGACEQTVILERDGRVHLAAKPPNDLGTVPGPELAALAALVDATDFEAIRSHPFTGTCPVAFDGQEFVYSFGTAHGLERVASCETDIDASSPLFAALNAALGSFLGAPD